MPHTHAVCLIHTVPSQKTFGLAWRQASSLPVTDIHIAHFEMLTGSSSASITLLLKNRKDQLTTSINKIASRGTVTWKQWPQMSTSCHLGPTATPSRLQWDEHYKNRPSCQRSCACREPKMTGHPHWIKWPTVVSALESARIRLVKRPWGLTLAITQSTEKLQPLVQVEVKSAVKVSWR